ncbi:gamma-glutamylcyclotransferase [Virgibacillus sp. JSM 102003]|uniref:gamma-glutamylcyclotransferase n=1 Tax=Virgibacillus sp. JSM 102003 TaxID=1562108 RepID=UPI0035BF668C
MPIVFVYGTLRKGERNHHFLDGAACIFEQCRTNGSLYDTNNRYPTMKESKSSWVYGELYEVTEAQLRSIDRLEGFEEGHHDNLYNRTTAPVYNDSGGEISANIYTAGQLLHKSTKRIPSGDWLVYNYLKQNDILYFAYGSCMDDERFKLAGVDQYFVNLKGKGTLNGFEFRFSRSSHDGGKADLVENSQEKVEGKVYQIPHGALEYLYKREGVYANAYRPAIVSVTINKLIYPAITFIGTEKSAETKPTELYATEIIRGGQSLLSNEYLQKIQQKIDRFN